MAGEATIPFGQGRMRPAPGSGELVVALARIGLEDSVAFWPADLPFDVRERLYGVPQDSEVFATEAWVRLVLIG